MVAAGYKCPWILGDVQAAVIGQHVQHQSISIGMKCVAVPAQVSRVGHHVVVGMVRTRGQRKASIVYLAAGTQIGLVPQDAGCLCGTLPLEERQPGTMKIAAVRMAVRCIVSVRLLSSCGIGENSSVQFFFSGFRHGPGKPAIAPMRERCSNMASAAIGGQTKSPCARSNPSSCEV